jgi:hypothetical protein
VSGLETEEIIAERVESEPGMFIGSLVFIVVSLAMTLGLVWVTIELWDSEIGTGRYFPIPFIILGSAFTLIFGINAWDRHIDRRVNRLVLEMDRVRLMRDERVQRTIEFGQGVAVDVVTKDGELVGSRSDVIGYVFWTRWREIRVLVPRGWREEDVKRMWPLVVSAAGKHEMRRGMDIEKLMIEEG